MDGILVAGFSSVVEKLLTGYGIPIEKNVGSEVSGATMNETGVLTINAGRCRRWNGAFTNCTSC